jgi:hypothetical protein
MRVRGEREEREERETSSFTARRSHVTVSLFPFNASFAMKGSKSLHFEKEIMRNERVCVGSVCVYVCV